MKEIDIKTSRGIEAEAEELYNSEKYNSLNIFQDKEWVSVDDIEKEIRKHTNCKRMHKINELNATCLDIILSKLVGVTNPSTKGEEDK